jgi:FecR protein
LSFESSTVKTTRFIMKWLISFALFASSVAWAQVATVANLSGAAQAIPAVGAPRDLRMGDALSQGDTIRTAAGSTAVIRFEDGQIVALSANSRMAISNYVYNKMEPAKSSILLNLIDGGMRAVTGLIGKSRPESVTYRAANATIGIRGTDVTIGVSDGNLVVSVKNGMVTFTIGSYSVTIPAGKGTYVPKGTTNAVVVSTADLQAAINKSGNQIIGDAIGSLLVMSVVSVEDQVGGRPAAVSGHGNIGTVQSVDNLGGALLRGTGSSTGSGGSGGGSASGR